MLLIKTRIRRINDKAHITYTLKNNSKKIIPDFCTYIFGLSTFISSNDNEH